MCIRDSFQSLKTPIDMIDSIYIKKWSETALQERISFNETENLNTIFKNFPNLSLEAGKYLVI